MNVFVNTWSVEGFVSEGVQPAELGWGTHEKWLPENGRLETRSAAGRRPTCCSRAPTRVYAPGPDARARNSGFLVTHNESISIADYFTLRDGARWSIARPATTPTTLERRGAVAARDVRPRRRDQEDKHILEENEIADGIDELGVLLYGHKKNAYWYGSQLSIDETREVAPYQNATGLQVTSSVLAGMVWALENPKAGIVETDEMDFRRCLEVQIPYLGPVIGTIRTGHPSPTDRDFSPKTSISAIHGSSATC